VEKRNDNRRDTERVKRIKKSDDVSGGTFVRRHYHNKPPLLKLNDKLRDTERVKRIQKSVDVSGGERLFVGITINLRYYQRSEVVIGRRRE
jgi:hypothetical protein